MATAPQAHTERRRSDRTALRLDATLRDGSRSKAKARLIDISTHGCRIECSATVAAGSSVWLNIASLETQRCRVVWNCEEFIGLEFEKPLLQAVFDKLVADQGSMPASSIKELRSIATRAHWLARQANESDIAILGELSRKCAEEAVIEGLKLGQAGKGRRA